MIREAFEILRESGPLSMYFQVKDLKFLVKCGSQKLISPLKSFRELPGTQENV